MAGTTVSFIADAALTARIREIARSDGVTQSQAAARASALGALLPPAARRTLRFVMDEGGDDARKQLSAVLAKAIAQVGNQVLERQLLARADAAGLARENARSAFLGSTEIEEELARLAVEAIADHRRQRAGDALETENGQEVTPRLRKPLVSGGGFGD